MNKLLLTILVWETSKFFAKKIWYYLHNKF
jgi:hypothetical protein